MVAEVKISHEGEVEVRFPSLINANSPGKVGDILPIIMSTDADGNPVYGPAVFVSKPGRKGSGFVTAIALEGENKGKAVDYPVEKIPNLKADAEKKITEGFSAKLTDFVRKAAADGQINFAARDAISAPEMQQSMQGSLVVVNSKGGPSYPAMYLEGDTAKATVLQVAGPDLGKIKTVKVGDISIAPATELSLSALLGR